MAMNDPGSGPTAARRLTEAHSGSGAGSPPALREPPRPATDQFAVGVLVQHGSAPYRFQRQGEASYFVTLRTERGDQTLWSRDLQRALVESKTQPQVGDAIGVRQNGVDPVTVTIRERNAAGEVVAERRADTPRGHWLIEKRAFFDERALAAQALRDPRTSRRDAVRSHPELLGAYWALDSAGKVADVRIANPESRQRFVALVREALALSIERGEPAPAAPTRDASRQTLTPTPSSRHPSEHTR